MNSSPTNTFLNSDFLSLLLNEQIYVYKFLIA